ncbi:hypothetical protein CRD86_21940 [Escherichia coli]|nr:hypothetical protein CRD86_21940 [Escherichia coli]
MLGGADNPNGELPSYITGADNGVLWQSRAVLRCQLYLAINDIEHTKTKAMPSICETVRNRLI